MQIKHFDILVCPACGSQLSDNEGVDPNTLVCAKNGHTYPVLNGIPRFVEQDNYAESFGFQWKKFSRVQMDSFNGTNFSEERFRSITNWSREQLAGKLVLDAGCGAGRFSEIVIKDEGDLVAIDLSDAVDACKDNISDVNPFICQASIYELPFEPGTFDFVYCIGVVQHTPDPVKTIQSLCRMVKPGGKIGLWIYERDWKSFVGTVGFKYALRPIFSLLSRPQKFSVCRAMVNLFFPIVAFSKSRGLIGKIIMRLLPISSAHLQNVPLQPDDFKAWVLLDTFDMYSPAYDKPQTYKVVANLLANEKFENIQRQPHGGIAITATHQA
ncbi:MAG TPA: methyltransferase domain-containing protein [Anaerolineales bacterium]|jgi:2-polyprenyl-3-methyl-5-hydroxy-6-metoxy-1,4-benzoquinol methylase